MSGYGLFQISTLGMRSQANRLNTISTNIANVNTGGYRRTDTEFETVLGNNFFHQSDVGGVKPVQRHRYDTQGLVTTTDRGLDLAISGQGFFAVQPDFNSTTQIFYTRDGSFQISTVDGQTTNVTADDGSTITVSNGYLVDKNGYFLLGSAVNADGTYSSSAAAPMRVDQYAFTETGEATTAVSLELNLPGNYQVGDETIQYGVKVYDSDANAHTLQMKFDRVGDTGTWRIGATGDGLTSATFASAATFSLSAAGATRAVRFLNSDTVDGVAVPTISVIDPSVNITPAPTGPLPLSDGIGVPGSFDNLAPGDKITVAGSTGNNAVYTVVKVLAGGAKIQVKEALTNEVDTNGTTISGNASYATPMTFDGNGQLTSATSHTVTLAWDNGETNTITIDLSEMSQFATEFTPFRSSSNGFAKADITGVAFDSAGHVVGTFSDGTQRDIYKIPLYNFTNINGLHAENGQVFEETAASGAATAFFADESSLADFVTYAHEISNVDISTEFTRMIQTQTAYNMNATAFRTMDEMTVVARDLKT